MSIIKEIINVNVHKEVKEETTNDVKKKPSKELINALKELNYMEKHPEEYKSYHDIDKMFENILNE